MKTRYKTIACFVLALALGGCSSNPSRTHRGNLLDEKVTEQRVNEALKRAGGDFNSVQALATKGVIVLSGTVVSPQLRSRAEQIARSVHRVSELKDDVQVRR